jgi:flagellar assembly protein FliH
MPSSDAMPFLPLGGAHAAEPFRPLGTCDEAAEPAPPGPDPAAEAFETGRAHGRAEARAEHARLAADVAALADAIAAWRQETRTRYTARLTDLALAVARKIVGEQLDLDFERWTAIVAAGARELVDREPVVVRVAPRLAAMLAAHRPALADPSREVRVVEDASLADGACVLESPSGDLDCGVDSQWTAIADALRGGDA